MAQGMREQGSLIPGHRATDEQLLKGTYKSLWKISAVCRLGFEVWVEMMI